MQNEPSKKTADTQPNGETASSDTGETLRAVRRIARALALSSRDLARRHDLTPTQLLCLRLLKDHEAPTAGTIAGALSLSPQTVTGLIDRLETRGLVQRLRSPNDRRQVLVSLSEQGTAVIKAAGPLLQDRFVTRFDALPAARRRSLRSALETIVSLLEADTLDAAPVLAPELVLESVDFAEASAPQASR